MRHSPDAQRIVAHPFAHHPKLAPVADGLARDPSMTFERAEELLCLAAHELGLTQLDIEAAQPEDATEIPFAPNANAITSREQSVLAHLHSIKNAR